MKRTLLTTTVLIFLCMTTVAQDIRVNAYGSYVFDDKVDSYYDNTSYYDGKINGGFQWGVGIEVLPRTTQGIELLYIRQSTKAPMTYYKNGVKNTTFDLGLNYIMLASNRYFRKPGGMVEGFAGGMMGANIISLNNPDNGNKTTKTKFAWGIRGGANIWASEKVGIKLQAQLLSSVQSAGGGLYFGTGGVGAGLSTYSSMYQFSLGGGLVFKIPRQKKS
jgi:hypothetical protein